MAPTLRMPSLQDLPRGPRRDLVEELFIHFRAAKRPTLREIDEAIKADDDFKATASRETVRRMLNGTVISRRWQAVEAVFVTLCRMANRDPDAPREADDHDPRSFEEAMEQAWHEAVDAPPPGQISKAADPWATDEPPF